MTAELGGERKLGSARCCDCLLSGHGASIPPQGATSSSQSLPLEVGKAQRKQAAEKGAFVESGGWSGGWREVASAVWPGRRPAGAATGSPLFTGGKSPTQTES